MLYSRFLLVQGFILLEVQRNFWPAKGEGTAVYGALCQVLEFTCMNLFNPLNNPCKLDNILLVVQPRKLRLREVKEITWAHTASGCQSDI